VTEEDLARGCIREDRNCQQELFRRYAGKMMMVCLRFTHNTMEAEDLLQDAFMRVFDHIHDYQGKGSLEGWIRKITVNTALRHWQQNKLRNDTLIQDWNLEIIEDPDVYAQLEEEDLLRLIAQLPEGYRLVFNMFAIEGYNHKEIADMLGIQESTSRSQLVKARKMLQFWLEGAKKIAV
jgi:RNA polymerase sigma-70 factor (ECF subfamily)